MSLTHAAKQTLRPQQRTPHLANTLPITSRTCACGYCVLWMKCFVEYGSVPYMSELVHHGHSQTLLTHWCDKSSNFFLSCSSVTIKCWDILLISSFYPAALPWHLGIFLSFYFGNWNANLLSILSLIWRNYLTSVFYTSWYPEYLQLCLFRNV